GLVTHQGFTTFTESQKRQRAAKIEPWNFMPIDRLCEFLLINKERRSVQRLIPDEIVNAPGVLSAATLRDDINHRAAVISVLSTVIVSQHLNLADGVLIDRHADLV